MSGPRDLVELVTRALADEPDNVHVTEVDHKGSTLIEVYAAPRDMGRLIGRQGRTISALRGLADVAAERVHTRVTVEVRDTPAPK